MESLDNHKRILGILYLISGALSVIGMLLLNAFFSVIFSFALNEADPEERHAIEFALSIIQFVPAIVIIFFSVPTLIASYGLLTRKTWGTMFALIVGCLKLFSFPIGTAIGVYSIWIFTEEQKLKKTQAA
jgi:uncharacterized membrane protein (DUF2068 family)